MKRILSILLLCLVLTGCATGNAPASAPTTAASADANTTKFSGGTVQSTILTSDITIPTTLSTTLPTVAPTTSPVARPTTKPATKPTNPTVFPTTLPKPLDSVEVFLRNLTLEEKVGQLFLVRCPEENAVADIEAYHPAGYILFGRDFENDTPTTIAKTISSYQAAASTPMFIAVDEEGGEVTRVSRYPAYRATPFPSPREIYEAGGLNAIRQNETEKSRLLSSLGINVNLAPVCDITTDKNAFMYDRSLGENPAVTAQFVNTALETMSQNGITGVLKHFPGYGNNADTHIGIAADDRPLSQLESCDLIPFRAAIDAGCHAIMVSHVYINAIDRDLPATLSPAVNQYLRQNMSFDGVIVSDDLFMQAITDEFGVKEAAVLAVLAGNDLLISTEYAVQYQAVLEAVHSGRISPDRIDQSVRRTLQWKIDAGILHLA